MGDVEGTLIRHSLPIAHDLLPIASPLPRLRLTLPGHGGRLSLRTMLEGQWWSNVMPELPTAAPDGSGVVPITESDLGFVGATFSLAYQW